MAGDINFQSLATGRPCSFRYGNYEALSLPDGKPHEIGRGGYGRIYKARHAFLGTEVALKVIIDCLAFDEAAKKRFLKEARTHARLKHRGIARIENFGEAEGTFYYVMELCPDGDLKDYVKKIGPVPPLQALELIFQAAEALCHAHRCRVLHRDVKPSNLLLVLGETKPQVKLIDFGLVKSIVRVPAEETIDHAPASQWSPAFASPEQMREQALDERTDIFSLGMTAWFLIAGGGPVEGTIHEIYMERTGPGSYEPRLPAALTGRMRAIVARMIEKDTNLRYRNFQQVLAELREVLGGMCVPRAEPPKKPAALAIRPAVAQEAPPVLAAPAAFSPEVPAFRKEGAPPGPPVISIPGPNVREAIPPPLVAIPENAAGTSPPKRKWVPLACAASVGLVVGAGAWYLRNAMPKAPEGGFAERNEVRREAVENVPRAAEPKAVKPEAAPVKEVAAPPVSVRQVAVIFRGDLPEDDAAISFEGTAAAPQILRNADSLTVVFPVAGGASRPTPQVDKKKYTLTPVSETPQLAEYRLTRLGSPAPVKENGMQENNPKVFAGRGDNGAPRQSGAHLLPAAETPRPPVETVSLDPPQVPESTARPPLEDPKAARSALTDAEINERAKTLAAADRVSPYQWVSNAGLRQTYRDKARSL